MTDHIARNREASRLAEAARIDLCATLDSYKAALLRRDTKRAEALRQQAHDLVDAMLDHTGTMAQILRDITEG